MAQGFRTQFRVHRFGVLRFVSNRRGNPALEEETSEQLATSHFSPLSLRSVVVLRAFAAFGIPKRQAQQTWAVRSVHLSALHARAKYTKQPNNPVTRCMACMVQGSGSSSPRFTASWAQPAKALHPKGVRSRASGSPES